MLNGECARQQRFLADAAHELRTPIAILHNRIELIAAGEISLADRGNRCCYAIEWAVITLVQNAIAHAGNSGPIEVRLTPGGLR